MTRARRVDANQAEIVAALRAVGCKVLDLSKMGNGVPDLFVWRKAGGASGAGAGAYGAYAFLEIKDGAKSPSKRQLTDDQRDWHREWSGAPVYIVTGISEALAALGVRCSGQP